MAVEPILSVQDVHAFYGRKIHALKGVSLEVGPGEVVALIGNNGAGKTTLLKTIAGVLKADQGEVRYGGQRVSGLPSHQIMRLGLSLVPEGRKIFPRLTVLENLEMGAYARDDGEIEKDLKKVYDLFPVLGKRQNQLGGTLSGGEQQMLAIGRALMARPKLLMLDEPSMGLAPVIVDRIFEVITEINGSGTPILLVEQNARKALKVATRGYVLETGRIVLTDTGKNLLHNESVRNAYLGVA